MATIIDDKYHPIPNLIDRRINISIGNLSGFQEVLHDQWDTQKNKPVSAWKQYAQMARQQFGDAAYFLDPDEVTAIKTQIVNVLRWKSKAEIFPTVQIGEGNTTHEYHKFIDVIEPQWTLTFEQTHNVKPLEQKVTDTLMGMQYDWHLTKPEIDKARRTSTGKIALQPNAEMRVIYNLTDSLRVYRDWAIFRGSSIPNMDQNINYTGILNDANLTDPGAMGIGADDDLTAAGDVYASAVKLSNKLIQNKFDPPFVLDMSPGVFSQANTNINATNSKSDLLLIRELMGENNSPVFSSVRINPFMISSATETNNTGAIACYKVDPDNFYVAESYPTGIYPKPPTTLGIDGKILWMGKSIVQRAASIQYANALTINTL